MGGACAVSYMTPIRHLHHQTIARDYVSPPRSAMVQPIGPHGRSGACAGTAGCNSSVGQKRAVFFAADPQSADALSASTWMASPMQQGPPTPPPPPPPFPIGQTRLQPRALLRTLAQSGLNQYYKYPSWRPNGSLLTAAGANGGPCWSQAELRANGALEHPLSAYAGSRVVLPRFPPRHEWFGPGQVELSEYLYIARMQRQQQQQQQRVDGSIYRIADLAGRSPTRRGQDERVDPLLLQQYMVNTSLARARAMPASDNAEFQERKAALSVAARYTSEQIEELRTDDYHPSHGCQAVVNRWCMRHCVSLYPPTSGPLPLMLARRRLCHVDECRRFNFKKSPTDWQCYPLEALSADRREVADWALSERNAMPIVPAPPRQAQMAVEEAELAELEAAEDATHTPGFCGLISKPGSFDWALLANATQQSSALLQTLRGTGNASAHGVAPSRARWAYARSFPRRLDGLRCTGFTPRADVSDAQSCQAACFALPATRAQARASEAPPYRCDSWQWCAAPERCALEEDARCWIGVGCPRERTKAGLVLPGWIGGTRARVIGFNTYGIAIASPSSESRQLAVELKRCLTVLRPDMIPRVRPTPPKKANSSVPGRRSRRARARPPAGAQKPVSLFSLNKQAKMPQRVSPAETLSDQAWQLRHDHVRGALIVEQKVPRSGGHM